jgi:hypothetical protein
VEKLFLQQAHVKPAGVSQIQQGGASAAGVAAGKCVASFPSKAHADLAFEALSGPCRPDKSNFPQKRVYLQGGGYLCVRKNAADA